MVDIQALNESKKQANALLKKVLEIAIGEGFKKRIKAEQKLPVRFPGDDGILWDPNWQDDWIDLMKPKPKNG